LNAIKVLIVRIHPVWIRTFFLIAVAAAMHNTANAQLLDSMAAAFQHQPRPDAFLDTRNSFISNEHVKVRGVKLGVNYNKTVQVRMGFSRLAKGVERELNLGTEEQPILQKAELRFWYISAYFDYNFYKTRHWHISIPLQLGVGQSHYLYTDAKDQKQRPFKGPMVLYEPAMVAVYKPLPWCGVGAGIGLRLMLYTNPQLSDRFTAPTYTVKFAIYFGELYKAISK